MDKEEARFILRCFRSDGADAADPSFAEALQFAAEDRELGEWLARERSSDETFAAALSRLELPPNLRDEIMAGIAVERGDVPQPNDWDAALVGALAGVSTPEGLREEILVAMRRSVSPAPSPSPRSRWRRWIGLPLAAAAGIALAFVVNGGKPDASGDRPALVSVPPGGGSVTLVSHIEDEVIAMLEDPNFTLDLKNPDHEALFRYIRGQGRACPQGCVPKGLQDVPGLGCRKLEIDGRKGAIVCFVRGQKDVVHLVVFSRRDLDPGFPDRDHRIVEQRGDWTVSRWAEKGRTFILLGNGLDEVF